MKINTFLILLVLNYGSLYSVKIKHNYSISQKDTIVFTSLKKAVKNSNDVNKLDLSGQNLKKFPNEILGFKNLVELNLGVREIYLKKRESKSKKYPPNHVSSFNWLFYKTKLNKISVIPNEIVKLDKLRLLNITGNNISEEGIIHLKHLLPNCEIIH